jgi:putative peptide zinc metalloprotease protein
MFLAFIPCPYVDASAAAAFRAKWHRIIVGAAGMLVELFLASLALFVWLNVEPGTVRTVMYDVMFIAGISTVLFNGNPLLRYDGYYMFADYLEIPNLWTRAQAYLRYLWERYAFGCREAAAEMAMPSERGWFVCYGIMAWVYRLVVFVVVAMFIAEKFFFIGVVFAVGGLVAGGVTPLLKLLTYLSTSPHLRRVRLRAGLVVGGVTALVVGAVCFAPVPLRSRAEGVIWVPEHAHVRAATDGFVERIIVPPGSRARQGDVLVVCRDPVLETRVTVLAARVQELHLRHTAEWLKDVSQAEILKEEMLLWQETLAHARERVAALTIHSPTDGIFVVPQAQDLPGQFVKQGTQLGYVLDLTTLTARVVVRQDDIDLVRQRTHGIEVRLAERLVEPISAVLWRVVPAATQQLPSLALSSEGGGAIATDPRDAEGIKTLQRLFQLDVQLSSDAKVVNVGGRVYVRFDHGWEPLVQRWYRHLRRLFLSKFYV